MYGDFCIRIERAENGYTVSMRDPKIVAANAKSDIKREGLWKDPNRTYVFDDLDKALAFIKTVADKALPPPEKATFDDAYDALTADDD